jgi:hypothetical protein
MLVMMEVGLLEWRCVRGGRGRDRSPLGRELKYPKAGGGRIRVGGDQRLVRARLQPLCVVLAAGRVGGKGGGKDTKEKTRRRGGRQLDQHISRRKEKRPKRTNATFELGRRVLHSARGGGERGERKRGWERVYECCSLCTFCYLQEGWPLLWRTNRAREREEEEKKRKEYKKKTNATLLASSSIGESLAELRRGGASECRVRQKASRDWIWGACVGE